MRAHTHVLYHVGQGVESPLFGILVRHEAVIACFRPDWYGTFVGETTRVYIPSTRTRFIVSDAVPGSLKVCVTSKQCTTLNATTYRKIACSRIITV